MNLQQSGEEGLLKLLTSRWRPDASVSVGVGDDCAVLRGFGARHKLLFKTDAVVAGVHFPVETEARLIGRKALARALSDIAAMGGEPRAALITLGVPAKARPLYLRRIYTGLEQLARRYRINLVGGETTRSRDLFISIAILGVIHDPVLRSTARAGDEIWVTGRLGGSRKGRHLTFEPRLKEGQWLARHRLARAMMDLSDGLGADLPRMARASGVAISLDETSIPRTRGASLRAALDDGEDYELLFAVAPRDSKRLLRQWPFRLPIARIGTFLKKNRGSQRTQLKFGGYDHFKKQ